MQRAQEYRAAYLGAEPGPPARAAGLGKCPLGRLIDQRNLLRVFEAKVAYAVAIGADAGNQWL